MFGFPKAERLNAEAFKVNFLHSVVWQISFTSNDLIIQKKNEVAQLFSYILPRVSGIPENAFRMQTGQSLNAALKSTDNIHKGYQLKSKDGQRILTISSTSILYEIGGRSYEKFESLNKEAELFVSVLAMCQIQQLQRIAIRKLNLIGYENSEDPVARSVDFADFLLNPSLSSGFVSLPEPNFLQQALHSVNYVADPYLMNLKYGLLVLPKEGELGQFVIDIDIIQQMNVAVTSMMEVFTTINNEIFDVFYWILSEAAINFLKKGSL